MTIEKTRSGPERTIWVTGRQGRDGGLTGPAELLTIQ